LADLVRTAMTGAVLVVPTVYRLIRSSPRPRASRAKHLVRVAAEYSHLLYHVTKAQTNTRSAFVDEIQWVCGLFP